MIKIQVARPCREPAPVSRDLYWRALGCLKRSTCPECFAFTAARPDGSAGKIEHDLVYEWVPLTEAVRLAHIEEAARVSKIVKR